MNDAQYLTQVTPEAPVARRDLVNRWVFGFAIANVVAQICVVLAQGIVRVIHTGMVDAEFSCDGWPYCDDPTSGLAFAGHWVTVDTLRWTAFLALLGIGIGLLVTTVKTKPTRTRPVRIHAFAALPLIGLVLQLGLALVPLTVAHPWVMIIQAGVSALWVLLGVWLVIRLGRPDVPVRPATGWSSRLMGWTLGVVGLATTWLGIIAVYEPDLANQDIAHVHMGLVIVLVALSGIGVVWAFKASTPVVVKARRAWLVLLVLLLAQLGLLVTRLLLVLPLETLALHLLGSTLVLTALVGVLGRLYTRVPVLSLSPGPA